MVFQSNRFTEHEHVWQSGKAMASALVKQMHAGSSLLWLSFRFQSLWFIDTVLEPRPLQLVPLKLKWPMLLPVVY